MARLYTPEQKARAIMDSLPDSHSTEDVANIIADLIRQRDDLMIALKGLYQSASILYNTTETHASVWAINLKKHKDDLTRAQVAINSRAAPAGGNGGKE